jgi:hypothetical protein
VHTAGFGLLVGVLGVAGRRTGRLPTPLAAAAVVSGTVGMLSQLYLVTDRAVLLIPAGRFSALLIAAVAGTLLGRAGPVPEA